MYGNNIGALFFSVIFFQIINFVWLDIWNETVIQNISCKGIINMLKDGNNPKWIFALKKNSLLIFYAATCACLIGRKKEMLF